MITAIGSIMSIIINVIIGNMMDIFQLSVIQFSAILLGALSMVVLFILAKKYLNDVID